MCHQLAGATGKRWKRERERERKAETETETDFFGTHFDDTLPHNIIINMLASI